MKYRKITDGVYIPEAETKEEAYTLAVQNLQKCYFIDLDGTPKLYDPITRKFGLANFDGDNA